MDGHFVPNLTIGAPVVKSLRKHTDLFIDCHLMITEPAKYLPDFAKAGANSCSVHIEIGQTRGLIAQTRDLGMKVGLVANPDTPFEVFAPFLADIDVMLLMTVFPGFGGQKFIESVLPKMRETAAELERLTSTTVIQVDGGIDVVNGPRAAEAGARAFVAGSAIFAQSNPLKAAYDLRASILNAIGAS